MCLEKELDSVERATWLAENYSLVQTPKEIGYVKPNVSHDQSQRRRDFVKTESASKGFNVSSRPNLMGLGFYCKSLDHRIRDSPKLKHKKYKPAVSNAILSTL